MSCSNSNLDRALDGSVKWSMEIFKLEHCSRLVGEAGFAGFSGVSLALVLSCLLRNSVDKALAGVGFLGDRSDIFQPEHCSG